MTAPYNESMFTSYTEEVITVPVNGKVVPKAKPNHAQFYESIKVTVPEKQTTPVAPESASEPVVPTIDPRVAELEAELRGVRTDLINTQTELKDMKLANGGLISEVAEVHTFALGVQAEYANYSKRVIRDRDVAGHLAVEKVATDLLPVLDDIVAARAAGDLQEGPFASIANKLETLLGNHGLVRIDEINVPFDPTIHEALMRQNNAEIPAEFISMMLRPGYLVGEKLIRAAQVTVSAGE